MEAQDNPFATPRAELELQGEQRVTKVAVYSPTQAAVGTFFGGPLSSVYFLFSNFKAMRKGRAALLTAAVGFLFSALLPPLIIYKSDKVPSYAIPVICLLTVKGVMNGWQMKKADILASNAYGFRSNWSVVLAALASCVAFLVLFWIELMICISVTGS